MRRKLLAVSTGLIIVLAAGAFVVARGRAAIPIDRSDVVSVRLQPVPEGPSIIFGSDGRVPIDAVRDLIPTPLPARVWQGFNCSFGGDLAIELSSGREVVYGPCRRPAAINKLWAELVDAETNGQCRPQCGP